MLSTKTTTKEKSVAPPTRASKKASTEEGISQIQLNPLWNSMATNGAIHTNRNFPDPGQSLTDSTLTGRTTAQDTLGAAVTY